MASMIGLKNPIWDLNKSRYEEIQDLPLMTTSAPIAMIISTYLIFVLKIGPNFMKKREAFKLNKTLLVYNVVQVLLSAYMVQRYFRTLLMTGLAPKKCYMSDDSLRKQLLWGIWVYLAAKITELLDTVFFVLRKKDNQITFLHLYHHSIMVVGTWASLKYWPSHNLYFIGFLNSLVHVFMYTYYGLAALGPHMNKYLTWKKYMTKFQLIQFITIIIQYCISVQVSECPPAQGVATFIACNTFFFFILFMNFYRKSYNKKSKAVNGIKYSKKENGEESCNRCTNGFKTNGNVNIISRCSIGIRDSEDNCTHRCSDMKENGIKSK